MIKPLSLKNKICIPKFSLSHYSLKKNSIHFVCAFETSETEKMDEDQKIAQLTNLIQSLQEKMALMEAENQVLRKHILLPSSGKQTAEPLKQSYNGVSNSQLTGEEHKESIEELINCVEQRIGVLHGNPVAAVTIYKCLLRWKSFEVEKTSVFDQLLQMFDSASKNCNGNEDLVYWLANSSALLILLQKSLKASVPYGPGSTPRKGSQPPPNSFFNTPEQGSNLLRQVEAEYPALLFKMQLTAFVETMYGKIRDNLRIDLSPLLNLAIQAPRATKASIVRGQSFKNPDSPRKSFSGKNSESPRKSLSDFRTNNSFKNSIQDSHWKSVTDNLTDSYVMLQENGVPGVLIQKLIGQTFSFINVQLFNSILLRRECCTFSNGEYVKYGLAEIEAWCVKVQEEHIGSAWDELMHIKQAVAFLVTMQKFKVSYDELRDLCPALTVQQLYRISTQFWDDKYNSQSVSSNVINSMRALMTDESSDVDSSAFLLDVDTSIPFTSNEISSAEDDKKFSQIIIPKEILEIPALKFLHD